jgi:glucose/sorbosone dehydrogenase
MRHGVDPNQLFSTRPERRSARARCAVTLFWVVISLPSLIAQGRQIALEWDPSFKADVVGYLVYVGRTPGVYSETYDVGNETWFVYTKTVPGQRYYFAMAAYTAARVTSEPSAEVTVLASASNLVTQVGWPSELVGSSATKAANDNSPTSLRELCFDEPQGDCYRARVTARIASPISSLVAAHDGRLLLIQDGEHVRVIAEGRLIEEPALSVHHRYSRLEGLALHPRFDLNRSVYVGEVETLSDGSRELTIIRYRELRNRLGEGAAMVSGIRIPPGTEARFTIDSVGRVYVAVPSTLDVQRATRYAYSGTILQFNADGTTASASPTASPIISRGIDSPSGLQWDSRAGQLWISGEDTQSPNSLMQLPLTPGVLPGALLTPKPEARLSSLPGHPFRLEALVAQPFNSTAVSLLLLRDSSDRLVRATFNSQSAVESFGVLRSEPLLKVVHAAAAPDGTLYLAAYRDSSGAQPVVFEILTLRRRE